MSLEGSIKDFGLSDIFQLILVQQKTGLMSIKHQSRRASVGFVKGMVVSAQVDEEEGMERIGEVLVRAKRVTAQQLEDALKTQQEGQYLGQILVARNAVGEADLKRALRLQILETVYRLFRWKEGQYRFDQRDVEYPKDYIEPISTEYVLMEGVRRLDEWPYIEKKIPSLSLVFSQVSEKRGEIEANESPAVTPAQPSATEEDPFVDLDTEDHGRFSAAEITVYHAVNGHDDVKRLIELVQLGEFEVCKALANLSTTGLVEAVAQPAATFQSEPSDTFDEDAKIPLPSARWAANMIAILTLLAVPTAFVGQYAGAMWTTVTADLQATKSLTLANQLEGLQQLVRLWADEHGRVPESLRQAVAEYGASPWSLTDPWGRSWHYDSQSGEVSSLGPDGKVDTDDDIH
ncbi:MAG: DUF4388 domain-containing protein [Nitrospirae bacterium]|nr:DUF4388 domain-containing protein [Nitrospirota bacterium]